MSRPPSEERIALLQARGEAQRLSAQLAMLDATRQLSPLRAAAGMVGLAAKALSPGRPATPYRHWPGSALADLGSCRRWAALPCDCCGGTR